MAGIDGNPPRLIKRARPWSREEVLAFLLDLPDNTLVGMDLGISLPFADAEGFFPDWTESPHDAKSLWALIDDICATDPNLEAGSFVSHVQASRYFRHSRDRIGDRFHLPDAATREGRFRLAEHAQRQHGLRPVSNFNLVGAAQVGKSSLTGMRMLNRLDGRLPVWPIDPLPTGGTVIVEIYTALAASGRGKLNGRSKLRTYADLNAVLSALGSPPVRGTGAIDDHSSDALVTAAWLRGVANDRVRWNPASLTPEIARTEGWTFGAL